ncbi:MAG: hypothetical protein ACE5G8_11500, partial [Anaerolineae bacterium]
MTSPFEQLLDYRRRVADLYHQARRPELTAAERCAAFRRGRDALFAAHPQSPLSARQKARFTGLRYYPHNPAWRLALPVDTAVDPAVIEMHLSGDGPVTLQRS